MGKINWARVLLGGLLAGFIINIFEYVTNGVVLAANWDAAMTWIRREFRCFRSKWPTIRHLSPKYLQQSLDFHKCSFSPPGVLVDESDGVSHSPTFG